MGMGYVCECNIGIVGSGDELKIDGGTWVDVFGLVFIIRLLAVLLHMPPLTIAEAGMWASTIASFAYSNTQGPKNG